ncbi:hypothetical protein ACOMHN_043686 [Nucella lapillus]
MASSIRPVVISGPSGSGKSTLLTRLFKDYPDCFAFSVSHTTRKPRPGETDGKDYHFVTMEKFEELIAQNGFLEHAKFSDNRYGTSKKSVHDILASGRLCFLDVEINGVRSIKAAHMSPTPRFIFIKPPSIQELRSRLQGRGTETEESLQKRLDTAQEALDYANEPGSYDRRGSVNGENVSFAANEPGSYDRPDEPGSYDLIIVNENVDIAYDALKGILINDIKLLQQSKQKAGK